MKLLGYALISAALLAPPRRQAPPLQTGVWPVRTTSPIPIRTGPTVGVPGIAHMSTRAFGDGVVDVAAAGRRYPHLAWLHLTIVASIFVTVICELAVFATGLPPLPRDVDLHQPDNERGTTPMGDVGGVQPTRGPSER
jgi:hypothetical protein